MQNEDSQRTQLQQPAEPGRPNTPPSPTKYLPQTRDRLKNGEPFSKSGLLPVRHLNRGFFLCDLFDYAIKDAGASMEVPLFTLSTKPDLSIWQWKSQDGSRTVEVIPSVGGGHSKR
jgi:hypothetical protein